MLREDTAQIRPSKSGLLENQGKRFFLILEANSVRDVNLERDSEGLTYGRKEMIWFGLENRAMGCGRYVTYFHIYI